MAMAMSGLKTLLVRRCLFSGRSCLGGFRDGGPDRGSGEGGGRQAGAPAGRRGKGEDFTRGTQHASHLRRVRALGLLAISTFHHLSLLKLQNVFALSGFELFITL